MLKRLMVVSIIFMVFVVACTPTAQEEQSTIVPSDVPTLVPTLQPSPLPTLQPSITPEPPTTPTSTPIPIRALAGEEVLPPFDISLPEDWLVGYDVRIFNDIGDLRTVPFAFYTGPVTGGTGFIVVWWDFPNAVSSNPLDNAQPDLYVDGLRLLRLLILESDCNVGTDLRREYSIGGRVAAGTQFSTDACPDVSDTRGWFAGLVGTECTVFILCVHRPDSGDGWSGT